MRASHISKIVRSRNIGQLPPGDRFDELNSSRFTTVNEPNALPDTQRGSSGNLHPEAGLGQTALSIWPLDG